MRDTMANNDISRGKFLKTSGLVAAVLTFVPGFASSIPGNKQLGNRSGVSRISGYKIVIPAQASAVEKQAAQQLQQYLSQMPATTIPVIEETEFRGNHAIYIGRTGYAKSHKIDFSE